MQRSTQIGRLGEEQLEHWCTQEGLSHNKSVNDNGGWDHLVEFPLDFLKDGDSSAPLDRHSAPLKCLVQVKSTDGRPGFKSINLKNWKHLSESPLPSFFLIFEFDGENEPQSAYLIHIGPTQIRRVKKRLRELSHEENVELHKREMRVTYDSRHKITPMESEVFKEDLLESVDGSPKQYSKEKIEWVETAGYENARAELDLKVEIPEEYLENPAEYLVDFSLGVIPEIEAEEITEWDLRFGIKGPEPTARGSGKVEIPNPNPEAGTLILSTDSGQRARLDGQYFGPKGLGPEITAQAPKVRFASRFTDWIIDLRDGSLNVEFDQLVEEKHHSLRSLKKYTDFLLFLNRASERDERVKVHLESEGPTGHLKGHLNTMGEVEAPGSGSEARTLLRAIENAWTFASAFNVQDEISVSATDLFRLRSQLSAYIRMDDGSGLTANISIKSAEPFESPDREYAVFNEGVIWFGELGLMTLFAVVGVPELKGKKNNISTYEIEKGDLRVVDRRVYTSPEEVPAPLELRQEAAELVEEKRDWECEPFVTDDWENVEPKLTSGPKEEEAS